MLEAGQKFPDFSLQDQQGKTHSLKNYKQWLLIYFYPKDNTSGCSLEAQDFSALADKFEAKKTKILGVSPDSVKSHASFVEKKNLSITLLSDPEHSLLEKAGVWQKKKLYGKEYFGVVRSTFLVDPKGTIQHAWPKVKVAGHAQEVLETLSELQKK